MTDYAEARSIYQQARSEFRDIMGLPIIGAIKRMFRRFPNKFPNNEEKERLERVYESLSDLELPKSNIRTFFLSDDISNLRINIAPYIHNLRGQISSS